MSFPRQRYCAFSSFSRRTCKFSKLDSVTKNRPPWHRREFHTDRRGLPQRCSRRAVFRSQSSFVSARLRRDCGSVQALGRSVSGFPGRAGTGQCPACPWPGWTWPACQGRCGPASKRCTPPEWWPCPRSGAGFCTAAQRGRLLPPAISPWLWESGPRAGGLSFAGVCGGVLPGRSPWTPPIGSCFPVCGCLP